MKKSCLTTHDAVEEQSRSDFSKLGNNKTATKINNAAAARIPNNVLNPQVLCTHAIKGTADAITEKVTT